MQKEKNKTIHRSKGGTILNLPPVWGEVSLFNLLYINSIKSICYERKH